jgi:hypothetical protein
MIPREETPLGNSSAQAGAAASSQRRERRNKRRISATECWKLISEKVHERIQQRGFVGGDALEDLADAARDLDEKYATDIYGLLALTEPEELVAQFRNLFAGYGLGEQSLGRLLDMNRVALEALAAENGRRANRRSDRVARGAPLLREAISEAITKLSDFIREEPPEGQAPLLAERENQAIRKTLKRLHQLETTVERLAGRARIDRGRPDAPFEVAIREAVVKAYEGYSARALAEAPVAALKGISEHRAQALASGLAIHTIRELADLWPVRLARAVIALVDAGAGGEAALCRRDASDAHRSLEEVADAPVANLDGLDDKQSAVLENVLNITTVRELADNRFVRTADAIVILASLED